MGVKGVCLVGDLIGKQELRRMIEVWLGTKFTGGRHHRRMKKIAAIEEGRDPRDDKQKQQMKDGN